MAVAGRQRAAGVLDWEPQKLAYVAVYDRLLRRRPRLQPQARGWPDTDRRSGRTDQPLTDRFGNSLVDLRDPAAVERYARTRKLPPRDNVADIDSPPEAAR